MVSNFDSIQALCLAPPVSDLSLESAGQIHAGHHIQVHGPGDSFWGQGMHEEFIIQRQSF